MLTDIDKILSEDSRQQIEVDEMVAHQIFWILSFWATQIHIFLSRQNHHRPWSKQFSQEENITIRVCIHINFFHTLSVSIRIRRNLVNYNTNTN